MNSAASAFVNETRDLTQALDKLGAKVSNGAISAIISVASHTRVIRKLADEINLNINGMAHAETENP